MFAGHRAIIFVLRISIDTEENAFCNFIYCASSLFGNEVRTTCNRGLTDSPISRVYCTF